jgi:PEP-CTERM motif
MLRRTCWTRALIGLAAALPFAFAESASATVIQATATSYTGDPAEVALSIDDAAVPGSLVITLAVSGPSDTIGDLRGFFLHVVDESLIAGLSVAGPDVTGSRFLANAVSGVSNGKYFNSIKMPCPCDLGVEFGTPGIGRDDLRQVTFTLSHTAVSLDLSFVERQQFGVRLTSVGTLADGREGSSKLKGTIPVVPEPSTALFLGLGFATLAANRRRSRSR